MFVVNIATIQREVRHEHLDWLQRESKCNLSFVCHGYNWSEYTHSHGQNLAFDGEPCWPNPGPSLSSHVFLIVVVKRYSTKFQG